MSKRLVVLVSMLVLASCSAVETMRPSANLVTYDEMGHPSPPPPPRELSDDAACKLMSWPLSAARATEILKLTQMFTQTGVYYSGSPTPQVAAFNVILDQPDPLPYLDEVANSAGVAGRLYALCAFQLLDQTRFARLAATLRRDTTSVFSQFGCTGMTQPVAELVDVVEKHEYGAYFREAKSRTYAEFSGPANICMQRTAGGQARDD